MANMDHEQLGELLSAYVDNELDDRERAFIERLIESDADVRRWYESLRKTVASVHALPQHQAPASLATDLQEQLERRALFDGDGRETSPSTVRFPWFGALSAAAVLVAATLVGITQYPQWFSPNAQHERLVLAPTSTPATDSFSVEREEKMAQRRDAADLTAKLTAGADLAAVRNHDFSNETVRLTVVLKDRRSQEAALDRIVSHLASARVVDVASPSAARTDLASHALFVNGKTGINYNNRNERQVLVRVPAAALDGLLDEVAVEAVNAERVTFAAGSLTFEGLDNARRTLRPLRPAEVKEQGGVSRRSRVAARGKRSSFTSSEAKGGEVPKTELADELLKILDIPSEVIVAAKKPGDRMESDADQTGAAFSHDKADTRGKNDRFALAEEVEVRTNAPMAAAPDDEAPLERGAADFVASVGDEDRKKAVTRPAYFVTLVLEFTAQQVDKPATTPTKPDVVKPASTAGKDKPARIQ